MVARRGRGAGARGDASRVDAAGSFGTGCFSFYATKNITTGEGGVVTTDDDDAAAAVRIIRNQGQRARTSTCARGSTSA